MEQIQLTTKQREIIVRAAAAGGGIVQVLEEMKIRGGARSNVLERLAGLGMAEDECLTSAAYDLLKTPDEAAPEASEEATPTQATRRTRENTKLALMIEMLRRSQGATIAQITEATGWQRHTVRGAFSRALKKDRGLALVSSKPEGGERVYRVE